MLGATRVTLGWAERRDTWSPLQLKETNGGFGTDEKLQERWCWMYPLMNHGVTQDASLINAQPRSNKQMQRPANLLIDAIAQTRSKSTCNIKYTYDAQAVS